MSTTFGPWTLEDDGPLAVLTVSKPPLNLFDQELDQGLHDAIRHVGEQRPRALLIRAEGRVFTGGVDVNLFKDLTPETGGELWRRGFELVHAIEDLPFPGKARAATAEVGFKDVAGLDDKSAVRIAGVRVGRVDGIRLLPDGSAVARSSSSAHASWRGRWPPGRRSRTPRRRRSSRPRRRAARGRPTRSSPGSPAACSPPRTCRTPSARSWPRARARPRTRVADAVPGARPVMVAPCGHLVERSWPAASSRSRGSRGPRRPARPRATRRRPRRWSPATRRATRGPIWTSPGSRSRAAATGGCAPR
ncbi:MAG: MCE family protein [Solirubrobacterales bacterium]|nr:MCE family protein [Solirubrobacterales bacterium]